MKRRVPPPKFVIWVALVLAVGLLGYLDYITGNELNFFLFYFLPVGWAAYRFGFVSAVATALLSAASWAVADTLAEHQYSSPAYAVWNTGVRLCAFLTIGWAVAKISTLLIHEREITDRLRVALAEVRVLEGLLPICAYCKKIRDDSGGWQQMESYISKHTSAQFSHGICPDCGRKLLAEAGFANPAPPTSPRPPTGPTGPDSTLR